MHRRPFLVARTAAGVVLTVSLLTVPVASLAQPSPKIGLLSIGTDPVKPNPVWVRFLKQLGELGYVEGQNVAFERRFAGGRQERLAEFVADLAERRVDVVVATSEVESIAAKRGLPITPIVMIVVQDPVEAGLVASLGAPGRHRDGAHDPGAGAVPEATRASKGSTATGRAGRGAREPEEFRLPRRGGRNGRRCTAPATPTPAPGAR